MTLYQKAIAVFGMLKTSIAQKASKSDIAPEFYPTATYDKGRLVIHDGILYRCTQSHSGEWTPSHFEETTVDQAIAYSGGGGEEGGGGGGGGEVVFPESLYARDSAGLFYKITIEDSGGVKVVSVDQNGISGLSYDDAYAKDESTGLYHKLVVEDSNGIKVLAIEQNGVTR